MSKVRLAFLWHMHQPSYRDPESGGFLLPWVRLHASRAYNDMALLLERHPAIRCTVNFTPVLLEQIDAYVKDGAADRFLELSRKAPASLTPEERQAILRSFFMIDWETVVKPHPRYAELLRKRGREVRFLDLAEVARRFSDEEICDLQVLFNLSWVGFAALQEDPALRALVRKQRGYSRGDCDLVLDAQRRILAEIGPRWRRLAERGQVELSSTPYYHPILPLVCDSDSAARALPQLPLPPRFAWPEDAAWQVREGMARHAATFGAPPRGMWPAEGSVSPEALEVLAAQGVRWAATDEGVLFHSLPGDAQRLRSLYRPWRVPTRHGEVAMLFRDRGLSDLIGFTYQRSGAREAVADFMGHLRTIGAAWEKEGHAGPATLGVFLDGENPWEHFPDSGEEFLTRLYQALATTPGLETVTLSEATADAPADPLPRLHSGSWIESSFRIWMGHAEDRTGWAALGKARAAVAEAERAGARPPEVLAEARRLLYAAEGSDWFWWYGDDFTTELALEFDGLFRSLVVKACRLVGAAPPPEALEPIKQVGVLPGPEAGPVREPTLLLTPTVDGRETTYFEWQGAGLHRPAQLQGAMFGSAQAFRALHFGFDLQAVHLRLDPSESAVRTAETCERLRVLVLAGGREVAVELPVVADGAQRPGRGPEGELGLCALARVLELSLPFAGLGLSPGTRVEVAVQALRGEVELQRLPQAGGLRFTVPDEDFERIHWRV
jgi:alpha-amylase/alpha-mannosidase (GH57 family)